MSIKPESTLDAVGHVPVAVVDVVATLAFERRVENVASALGARSLARTRKGLKSFF